MAADLMNDTISHIETIADVFLRQLKSPFCKEKKTEYPQPERTPARPVLRQRHHEQVQRGLGVWGHDHVRHGGGDRTRRGEELQGEIFYE